MKKIFSILTLSLALLNFVSCEKKNADEPENPGNQSEQTDPTTPSTDPTKPSTDPSEPSPAFTISISNITSSSALMTVTPDVSLTYYFTIIEASYVKEMTDEQLIQQVLIAEMDYIIDYYKSYGISYEDLLSTGNDSYEFTELTAGTEYLALAGYIDENGKSTFGLVTRSSFTTSASGSSQGGGGTSSGNLSFTVNKSSTGITVTPSNNTDLWDYYFMEQSQFTSEFQSNADYVALSAFEYYGTTYAVTGPEEFLYSEMLSYGLSAGNYVLIIWGCDNSGVTTNAQAVTFTLSSSSSSSYFAPARATKGLRGPGRAARMRKTAFIKL